MIGVHFGVQAMILQGGDAPPRPLPPPLVPWVPDVSSDTGNQTIPLNVPMSSVEACPAAPQEPPLPAVPLPPGPGVHEPLLSHGQAPCAPFGAMKPVSPGPAL